MTNDRKIPAWILVAGVAALGGTLAIASASLAPGCARHPRFAGHDEGSTASVAVTGKGGSAEAPAPPPASDPPGEACVSCHGGPTRFLRYGGHAALACEDCHGDAKGHVLQQTDPREPLPLPGNGTCLECHDLEDAVEGPPDADLLERHMRFLEEKHVIAVDRGKVAGTCVYCHDPHLGQ